MPFPPIIEGTVPEQEPGTVTKPGLGVGSPSLPANTTTGFLYIPQIAGPPTGVPVGIAGMTPMAHDTVNNRLYWFRGGGWHYFQETA